jgi:thiol:disulfide interchange protein DsbD
MKATLSILIICLFFLSCEQSIDSNCSKSVTQHSFEKVNVAEHLDSAKAYAYCTNKPLLIFFTAWAGVSCRKMESVVFNDPKVARLINDKFSAVALFVDDQSPIQDTFYSEYLERTVLTKGDKNYHFQLAKFKMNTQPFFAMLDTNQNVLSTFYYEPDELKVRKHLSNALDKFKRESR